MENNDPPEGFTEPDRQYPDIPDEWLEDLHAEAAPDPDRIRGLANKMAKNADLDGDVDLPAKAFVRTLLLIADQMEQAMRWAKIEMEDVEVDGIKSAEHRDVTIRASQDEQALVATVQVPASILSYGHPTTIKHVLERMRALLDALKNNISVGLPLDVIRIDPRTGLPHKPSDGGLPGDGFHQTNDGWIAYDKLNADQVTHGPDSTNSMPPSVQQKIQEIQDNQKREPNRKMQELAEQIRNA